MNIFGIVLCFVSYLFNFVSWFGHLYLIRFESSSDTLPWPLPWQWDRNDTPWTFGMPLAVPTFEDALKALCMSSPCELGVVGSGVVG